MLSILKKHSWLLLAFAVMQAGQSLPSALAAKMPKGDGVGPQIGKGLDRTPSGHILKQDTDGFCDVTPLRVDIEAYASRCSVGKGPCFKFGKDSLKLTRIVPWLEPLDMSEELIIADDDAQAFTVSDPSYEYEINFLSLGGAKLRYSNYDAASKCFDIDINRADIEKYVIFVGHDDDIFSTRSGKREKKKRFCTDKLYIHFWYF